MFRALQSSEKQYFSGGRRPATPVPQLKMAQHHAAHKFI